MALGNTLTNENNQRFYLTEEQIHLRDSAELIDRIPQDTTLYRLVLECHEHVINAEVQIPSDELVADVMLEIMYELLQPERIVRDAKKEGQLWQLQSEGKTTFNNPIFDSSPQGDEYLNMIKEVFLLYRNSPILQNLQERIAGLLCYCANSTTKDITEIEQILSIKQKFGTPLMGIDLVETIGAGMRYLAENRGGSLKSPLFNILGLEFGKDEVTGRSVVTGGSAMLRIPRKRTGSEIINNQAVNYTDIQNILHEMTRFFDFNEDEVQKRQRILRLLYLLMLISLATTACAQLGVGDGGPQINNQPTDDSNEDDKIITPTQTLQPTIVPTETLTKSVDIPIPSPIPTQNELQNDACATSLDTVENSDKLVKLLESSFNHFSEFVDIPENMRIIDPSFGYPENVDFVEELARLLSNTSNGEVPDLCRLGKALAEPAGSIVLLNIQSLTEGPFQDGKLVVSPSLIEELAKQGLVLYLDFSINGRKAPVITDTGRKVTHQNFLLNATATGDYPREAFDPLRNPTFVLDLKDVRCLAIYPKVKDKGVNLSAILEGIPYGINTCKPNNEVLTINLK